MPLREEILEVSKEILIKDGFSKMSMRRIAKRANVSATSIYLHFKNKDDLLVTLIEESIAKLKSALIEVLEPSGDLINQLENIARKYVEYALKHPQEYEIIYMVRPEEMPKYPKEKFRDVRSAYELIAEVISEGNRKEFVEGEDSLISAYTLWAQIHGVASVIISKRLDTRIPQDKFIDHAIEQIIKGFINQKTPA
jgi:AcrR family transcriptional regulator